MSHSTEKRAYRSTIVLVSLNIEFDHFRKLLRTLFAFPIHLRPSLVPRP